MARLRKSGSRVREGAAIDGITYTRDPDGVWRYSDSRIPVPGARDLTLTERFEPKIVSAARGGQIERVLVDGKSISEAPDLLGWCLEVGTQITDEDGGIVEVLVPYDIWQEHDRVPSTLFDPARSGTPAERELARAELSYREAEQEFEKAAEHRAEVLRRLASEMTRQEARAITGLSVSRIQQLIQAGPTPAESIEVDQLNPSEAQALMVFSREERSLDLLRARASVRMTRTSFNRAMNALAARGLIEQRANVARLTEAGARLKIHVRRRELSQTNAEGAGR